MYKYKSIYMNQTLIGKFVLFVNVINTEQKFDKTM